MEQVLGKALLALLIPSPSSTALQQLQGWGCTRLPKWACHDKASCSGACGNCLLSCCLLDRYNIWAKVLTRQKRAHELCSNVGVSVRRCSNQISVACCRHAELLVGWLVSLPISKAITMHHEVRLHQPSTHIASLLTHSDSLSQLSWHALQVGELQLYLAHHRS